MQTRYQLHEYNSAKRIDVKSVHWTNPSAIELSIEQWLTDNKIAVSITGGYATKRDSWECDQWRVAIWRKAESFIFETDYFTGTGHRAYSAINQLAVKRATAGLQVGSIAYRNAIRHIQKVSQTPHVASVLHSLVMDAISAEESFSSWCDNFGYSSDSIQAFNTYQACEKIRHDILKVITIKQLQELQELLQDY